MTAIRPNPFHNDLDYEMMEDEKGRTVTYRNNRNRYFFPDEWKIFYDSLQKRKDRRLSEQQIMFNMLLHTGARINEARNVKVGDVDFERGNIMLRVTKKIVNRPGIQKKGISKKRIVTISTQFTKFLKKAVRDYDLTDDDYFFEMSTQGANQAMERKLKKIGIPDYKMFSIHNIRKTAENWLIALGIDWNKVIKQFGHSPNISLKHYLSSDIFGFDEKREISQILGDIREKMMGDPYGRRF